MQHLPAWNDPDLKAGTMVRAALWLVQEVGLGQTFTKEDIRTAFPGVAQADRRMRDLRSHGWVLHTNIDDASLLPEQTRYVAQGTAVWDPKERRSSAQDKPVTNKERTATLARDNYVCTLCGIAGGEEYSDGSLQTAVLSVSRRPVTLQNGRTASELVSECGRCRAGWGDGSRRADKALATAETLSPAELTLLRRWVDLGRRPASTVDIVWSDYLRLPEGAKAEFRASLDAL